MMKKPALEVADIFRRYYTAYIKKFKPSAAQKKVMHHIMDCRTAALGGHLEECTDHCGFERPVYNSCRDRHCPKCQFHKSFAWIEKRKAELLPVTYFHIIFTLPTKDLLPIILPNKKLFYNLLFQAASQTLMILSLDPKWLGAHIGCICTLHTWTQRLIFHPHIHCIVPGGGFDKKYPNKWRSVPKQTFFIHFNVLADKFRNQLIKLLKQAHRAGQLSFFEQHQYLDEFKNFASFLEPLKQKKWVAYSKPSFKTPLAVIKYLGNYIHRIAISNHRLIKIEDDQVFFKYQDRADNNKQKTAKLPALNFIHLFLQHVLPYRFVKTRSYGFLANRTKKQSIQKARLALNVSVQDFWRIYDNTQEFKNVLAELLGPDANICPKCKKGRLVKTRPLLKIPIRGP
jgi:hypothetical protein